MLTLHSDLSLATEWRAQSRPGDVCPRVDRAVLIAHRDPLKRPNPAKAPFLAGLFSQAMPHGAGDPYIHISQRLIQTP
jgi:hypothetical protein